MEKKLFYFIAFFVSCASAQRKLGCPCHFELHFFENGNFTCVAPIPIQAATAKGANDSEDAPDDETFGQFYLEKACEYYGNSAVFYIDDEADGTSKNVEDLPPFSLFFQSVRCNYIEDASTGMLAQSQDCKDLMDNFFFENVICKTGPVIDFNRSHCSCPCGFFYDDDGGSCVGSVVGCEPMTHIAAMYLLSYAVLPSVAMIARVPEGSTTAPDRWPNYTMFFIGPPKNEGATCAYKDRDLGGMVVYNTCEYFFTNYEFYSVLLVVPEVHYNKSHCPMNVSDPMKSCDAVTLNCQTLITWYTLAVIWAICAISFC